MKRGFSRTGQVFKRWRGDGGSRPVSAEEVEKRLAEAPGYVPRLAWRPQPRQITDWPLITEALASDRNMVFFCDNSFISDTTPQEVWEVLLSTPGRFVLTPRVMAELRPWILRNPGHPLAVAIRDGNPAVIEYAEPDVGEDGRVVFDYYMALLSIRRRAHQINEAMFVTQNGRAPTDDEKRQLAVDLQRELGPRALLLATKDPGMYTDEALVYLAVEHALKTGVETVVLTSDADVEEQFFKLLWLLNTHYRGFLLAKRFAEDQSEYETYPVPPELLEEPGPFDDPNALIIERHPDLLEILPEQYHFVGISCINAGVYYTHLAFGAETEMAQVLSVKDATGGLSTEELEGRNMYASIHPIPTGRGHDCGAVGFDRRKPVGVDGASVTIIDITQALTSSEQIAHIIPSQE
jgi:hypothetical protein